MCDIRFKKCHDCYKPQTEASNALKECWHNDAVKPDSAICKAILQVQKPSNLEEELFHIVHKAIMLINEHRKEMGVKYKVDLPASIVVLDMEIGDVVKVLMSEDVVSLQVKNP